MMGIGPMRAGRHLVRGGHGRGRAGWLGLRHVLWRGPG